MQSTIGWRRAAGLVLAISGALVARAEAQPRPDNPKDGPVYLEPHEADEDFVFQGEYLGWRRSTRFGRQTRPAGLQVYALGNGEFAGALYPGGLPGEGWVGGLRESVAGQRQDQSVELTGATGRIVVDGSGAQVYSGEGDLIGAYHKVHRISPTMGAIPPAGATVLFDGRDAALLVNPAVTPEGWLQSGTETAEGYGDFRMHAEFRLPYKPLARGQNRGNSGIYLQSRYEVQILDSFGLEGVENECGALYKTRRPDINMCYPPLSWQTYDLDLTSPRFDAQGRKLSDMRISVWHNGVPVHSHVAIPDKTGAGKPEGPDPLPTKIQDHSNPVMFRNIWLVSRAPSLRPGSSELVSANWRR